MTTIHPLWRIYVKRHPLMAARDVNAGVAADIGSDAVAFPCVREREFLRREGKSIAWRGVLAFADGSGGIGVDSPLCHADDYLEFHAMGIN